MLDTAIQGRSNPADSAGIAQSATRSLTASAERPNAPARADRWTFGSVYALALLTGIWALSFTDRQLFGLLSPLIKKDLSLSDTSLGLITGFAFVLLYSLLGVPIGRLADRANRRDILGAGLVLWSLMTSLTGLAGSVSQLVLARMAMGAGEAAANAPTTSFAADLVGRSRQQTAMAVLSAGAGVSALVFIPIAGWLAQAWGWRSAFQAAGGLGLAMAALLVLTVREPRREVPTAARAQGARDTVRFLLGLRTYLLTVLGGAFIGVSLYASQAWHPSFLARVHHLGIAQIGLTTGLFRGLAAIVGTLAGGILAERLGRRDPKWRLLGPGLACILAMPCELVFLLSHDLTFALVGMLGYHLLTAMQFGPVYAACLSLARPAMGCTATALFLLVANFTGQIVGPLAVGFFNDRWAASFGDEAIRYSLVLGSGCVVVGGGILALASLTLDADTKRAQG